MSLLEGLDRRKVERRFWKKVSFAGRTKCWLWTASEYGEGYGGFQLGVKRCVGAHRVAYEWAYGPVPEGHFVLHACDNRKCCNPKHLFVGTHQTNMDDMAAKGRSIKGREFQRSNMNVRETLRRQAKTVNPAAWCPINIRKLKRNARRKEAALLP